MNEIDISFDTLPSSVEVFDKIGEGASSVVFDGFDYEHQRSLAIRFLKPELRTNPQECQSFWDEVRMLASLGLSHTIGVHQIDQDGGFVLMERAWQPVRESARKSPVDPQVVERVLADTLRGLSQWHARGYLHANVGVPNLYQDQDSVTKLGGTSGYQLTDQLPRPRDVEFQLAPEVLNPREFGDVSYAADLYSLGMSVIALLSGKQKFWTLFRGLSKSQRNDPMAWARWQASSENLPPMAQLFPNASPQLTFTLDKLIQKSVHDRVASADEAFSMLRALETHSSSIAEPATSSSTNNNQNEHLQSAIGQSRLLEAPQLSSHRPSAQPAPESHTVIDEITDRFPILLDRKFQIGAICLLLMLCVLPMVSGKEKEPNVPTTLIVHTEPEPSPKVDAPIDARVTVRWNLKYCDPPPLSDLKIFINGLKENASEQDGDNLSWTSEPLQFGEYRLRIESDKFKPIDTILTVNSPDTKSNEVAVDLVRKPHRIMVFPATVDLKLTTHHASVSKLDEGFFELAGDWPNDDFVTIQASGYHKAIQPIQTNDGGIQRIELRPIPKPKPIQKPTLAAPETEVLVNFVLTPGDSQVFLDGKLVNDSQSSPVAVTMIEGDYSLEIRHSGYKAFKKRWLVEGDQTFYKSLWPIDK